jgi:hypothetical protein
MKLEFEAGNQVRLFHFGAAPSAAESSWQGQSVAEWQYALNPPRTGELKVLTSRLRPGYLRKTGVPYGAKVTMTEYYLGGVGEKHFARRSSRSPHRARATSRFRTVSRAWFALFGSMAMPLTTRLGSFATSESSLVKTTLEAGSAAAFIGPAFSPLASYTQPASSMLAGG